MQKCQHVLFPLRSRWWGGKTWPRLIYDLKREISNNQDFLCSLSKVSDPLQSPVFVCPLLQGWDQIKYEQGIYSRWHLGDKGGVAGWVECRAKESQYHRYCAAGGLPHPLAGSRQQQTGYDFFCPHSKHTHTHRRGDYRIIWTASSQVSLMQKTNIKWDCGSEKRNEASVHPNHNCLLQFLWWSKNS